MTKEFDIGAKTMVSGQLALGSQQRVKWRFKEGRSIPSTVAETEKGSDPLSPLLHFVSCEVWL